MYDSSGEMGGCLDFSCPNIMARAPDTMITIRPSEHRPVLFKKFKFGVFSSIYIIKNWIT